MSDIDDCAKSVERLTRDRGEVMRAGNDRIDHPLFFVFEKIRARHAEAEIALRGAGSLRKVHPHDAPEWAMDAHDDRAALLSEVERLRETVGWYGDRARALSGADNKYPFSDLFEDAGARARSALEAKP